MEFLLILYLSLSQNIVMYQIQWKPVKNYEGLYEINQFGKVRSLYPNFYHKIISERIDRAGYNTVKLNKKGKGCTIYIHRILAFAFIENSENKPIINHKDCDKLNNSLSNLEWCTKSENGKHAHASCNCSSIPKKVYDSCQKLYFNSIKSAASHLQLSYSDCKNYLNGNLPNPTCLQFV